MKAYSEVEAMVLREKYEHCFNNVVQIFYRGRYFSHQLWRYSPGLFFLFPLTSMIPSFVTLLNRLIRYSSLNASDLVNSPDDQTSLTGSLDSV
jgi:hypothetical protein